MVLLSIYTKLKWNDQCQYLVNKTAKCLNPLRQTVFGYTQDTKAIYYRALVRACLEYACAVWSPYTAHDIDLLESIQNRAARWIKNYWDSSVKTFDGLH